jgi:putative transposase
VISSVTRSGNYGDGTGLHRNSIKDRFPRFPDLLATEPEADLSERLRAAESIGRPLGNDRFLARLERSTGRSLKSGKRGPKQSEPERN